MDREELKIGDSQIVIYHAPDGTANLDVKLKNETVWLNRQQMSEFFNRDIKTIGKHINNALSEELDGFSVVAKFATTAADGKTYQVEHYNLDMILSVGYRVKSKQGIQFRGWANKVLKEYLIKGYAVSEKIKTKQYEELKQTVKLLANVIENKQELSGDEATGLFLVALTLMIAESRTEEKDLRKSLHQKARIIGTTRVLTSLAQMA
jgi:hypothetical protein